jgi:hypothetical protein
MNKPPLLLETPVTFYALMLFSSMTPAIALQPFTFLTSFTQRIVITPAYAISNQLKPYPHPQTIVSKLKQRL